VTITNDGTVVKFADATVTTADVETSNGVIHVIDKVVLPPAPAAKDIVATAMETGAHGIFAEALTKANLVDALKGVGPFTVFAPTDTAFSNALAALAITKQQLLDRKDLASILKYHVLPGKTMAATLAETQDVDTLQGQKVTITSDGATVKFADATVTMADVETSNGVIHVIDTVVLPPATAAKDIVETAMGTGAHGILAEALTKANLVDTLQGAGPFTVFAPTDTAFSDALIALGVTKQELLDRADLADILKYHVLSGKTMSDALGASQDVNTLAGLKVTITKDGATVNYADATVITADVETSNGVIHVIDKVVLPPSDATTTAAAENPENADLDGAYQTGILPTVMVVLAGAFLALSS